MRGLPRILAPAAILCAAIHASADDSSTYIPNDPRKGLVTKAIEPHLPRQIRYASGQVDVEGVLTPAGSITELALTPDREESAVFVEPLRALLPQWRFRAQQGPDCAPSKTHVRLRIRFEGGDMQVLHSPVPEPAISPQEPGMRAVHKEAPRYPLTFLQKGVSAHVYARADVAADGSVSQVRVRAFSRHVEGNDLLPFEIEATKAARKWVFTRAPETLDRPRYACLTFTFNFLND